MFARAALSLAARAPATPVRLTAARSMVSFENDHQILSDNDQMAGRRKVEIDDAKKGLVSRKPCSSPRGKGGGRGFSLTVHSSASAIVAGRPSSPGPRDE